MNDLKGIIEDCNKSDLVSDKVIKKIIEIIGQEEWQDLHDENNDICTTMGELIITLKGIEYLEKENAELKSELHRVSLNEQLAIKNGKNFLKHIAELEKQVKDLEWQLQEVLKDNDNYQTDNERLEKENAELKEQLGDKIMQKQKDKADLVWKLKTANEQKAKQLTKAKELLKKVLDLKKVVTKAEEYLLLEEAEQFLNEVEK